MTRYRVLIKQDEYRNAFTDAESEAQAIEKVMAGNESDSEFVGNENTEVIDVEVWE